MKPFFENMLGHEKIFVKIVGIWNQKSILNCKLFVTTQNGRVANSWKCSYFNQHLLQTICNMSEDVQYELGYAVQVQVRMCSINQAPSSV